MDKKRRAWVDITDPESLRHFLLRSADEKLAHAAGARYAEAVKCCLQQRDWKNLQDWQIQRLVRQEILGPLQVLVG